MPRRIPDASGASKPGTPFDLAMLCRTLTNGGQPWRSSRFACPTSRVDRRVKMRSPHRPAQPRRRSRTAKNGQPSGKGKVEWGLPHRGRISPEEAAHVREHLDEVQKLRAERGVPLLDPADPKTKERYGL
jgi:hypothetical protein